MKNHENKSEAAILRQKAEELLKKKPSKKVSQLSETEITTLIFELEVHQIELELQNEQLRHQYAAAEGANDKYIGMYDSVLSGYFTLSSEGEIIELNLTGAQMLGKDRSQLISSSFGFFVSDDTKPVFRLFLEKVFNSNIKESCEVNLTTSGIQPRFVHLSSMATEDKKQCVVTAVNITDRKHAEKMLHDIIDRNPMSIQILDIEGYTIQTNSAHLKLFGARVPEGYSLFKDPQLLQQGFSELFDRMKNGEVVSFPDSYFNAHDVDSSFSDFPVTVKATGFSLFDSNGIPENFVIMQEDITERKMTEEALRESEEKYSRIFATSPYAIMVTDAVDGKIIEVNKAFTAISGYTREEAVADSTIGLRLWANIDDRNKVISALSEGRGEHSTECLFNTKYGKIITGLISAQIIYLGNKPYVLSSIDDITERKLSQDALMAKTAILNNLIINLKEGVLLEDSNRKIALTNQLFCDMFAIPAPPQALIGADCSESAEQNKHLFINPEKFVSDINRILTNKKAVYNDELELLDGRQFERDYIPTWLNEAYSGHLWKYRDITERKQAQQKLQASEERYRSIFQRCPDGILITDVETKMITYANEAQCRIFGYTEEQFKTMSIAAIHPQETFEHAHAEFESRLHGEKDLGENIQCLKRNGEIFFADISGALISLNGRAQLLGFFRDITERKNAEQKIIDLNANLEHKVAKRTDQLAESNSKLEKENAERLKISTALQESLDRLNKIADRVPGVVYQYRLNPDGSSCFPFASDGIHDIYRVSPEEVAHDASIVFSKIHPDDFDGVVASIQASAKDHTLWQHEYRVKFDDVTLRWLSGNAQPQTEADGTILWHGYISDITDRKQAEAAIIKAKDEAVKANQAKSEFLSRMSHELRTPLNSILGFAQLMEMGELSASHKNGVYHILNSGKHLLNLINEVLDISGIEAGRISLAFIPVQLGRIIGETFDTVQPLANALNVKLELTDSGQNLLFVKADHHRLRQVLLNLINNAVKYNHEGGSVMIKTELQQAIAPANSLVRISVTDTGRGISPEFIDKLFLPFERIGAEKTGIEGTGLGLMVVKKLMDAMGGRVGLESVPGEGSTFWIELPHVEDHKTGNRQQAIGNGQETIPENEKAGTILYIEDNASNTELVKQILLDHRLAIHLVSSMQGAQAVSLAIKYAPDLILLDLDLPDIQGFEVIRLLQAEEKTKEIPVVIISADAMPHQIEKLIKSGSKDYLTKPLDIKAFLQVVDEWVGSANKKTI